MDLDDEELEATRKLNGVVKKSNIEEDIKILKEFVELDRKIRQNKTENDYEQFCERRCVAIEHILAERKQDKTRIKELEAKLEFKKWGDLDNTQFEEYINQFLPKQKVKDLSKEIQEEYNEVQEQFDYVWNKKSKDDYDRYKLQEFSAMQQQLGFFIGKLEEILEDK